MFNFNRDLAAHLVGQLENHFWDLAKDTRGKILAELGEETLCENCECDSISYNDTDAVVAHLVDLILGMDTAPVAVVYGQLVPRFLCISKKLIETHSNPAKSNGKNRSKPVVESPKEDSSGA